MVLVQKEVIWNDKKWIIDYETGTIYQKAVTAGLPVQVRVGNYHFKKFKDELYFATADKFYKIISGKVLEVSKEEYDEIYNYRTLNKKDPATLKLISTYVISFIIDDIMHRKFNLTVSIPVENSNGVNIFSKKFTPVIVSQIKRITMSVIAILPIQVNKKILKQTIHDIYESVVKEDEDLFNALIDNIYLNDKERFDFLSENITRSNNLRKNNQAKF